MAVVVSCVVGTRMAIVWQHADWRHGLHADKLGVGLHRAVRDARSGRRDRSAVQCKFMNERRARGALSYSLVAIVHRKKCRAC